MAAIWQADLQVLAAIAELGIIGMILTFPPWLGANLYTTSAG
jgi:hypothetical protein